MTKFSLIMATIGRSKEIGIFLEHLKAQTDISFELIIIDQNKDDRLHPIIAPYLQSFKIIHHQVDIQGLSKARNIGIKMAKGKFIAFPDDDCFYPQNMLNKIEDAFQLRPNLDFITFKCLDPVLGRPLLKTFPTGDCPLRPWNIMRIGMSISIFVKRQAMGKLLFDEELGSGAKLGSGEESDFLFKLLKAQKNGHYFSHIQVYHPFPQNEESDLTLEKTKKYALGHGQVLRAHLSIQAFPQVLWSLIIRPGLGLILTLKNSFEFKNTFLLLHYRWKGFLTKRENL
jgi:glycosyltransferase involved in cell wall biosynthesis